MTLEVKENLYFWPFYWMTGIYLLLGSNLGDRSSHLDKASKLISQQLAPISQESSRYRTEAWGMSDAPTFLNQVLAIDTGLKPLAILANILKIEIMMGRNRQEGYQNRTIDIDLLYYGDTVFNHPVLSIPHPRISVRRFVLKPLVEIAPEFVHPVLGLSNLQLLDRCMDSLSVTVEGLRD